MKFNKMIPLILAVIMAFSAIPVPVSAEEAAHSPISYLRVISSEISAASDAVQIALESTEEVCGGGFTVVYDSAVLEAYQVDVPFNASYTVQSSISSGRVNVSFASGQAIASETLISIRFRIRVESSTSTQIMLENMKLYNADTDLLETEAKNAVCTVKKIVGPSSVRLSKSDLVLGSGDTYELKPLFLPSDAAIDEFRWESSNESIVKVDQNGVLTAYGTGTATINYSVYSVLTNWLHASCNVTVYSKPNITVSDAQASAGAILSLPVRMESSGNSFMSGSMNFVYDPEYLRFISCNVGELLQATMVTINGTYREDAVRMNFAGQLPLAGAGTLCVLTFEVLKEGNTTVSATDVMLYTDRSDSYNSNLENGTVNIATGTLSVSDYSGSVGVGFILKLSYDGNMPIAGGSVTLQYDPEKLVLGDIASLDSSVFVLTNEEYAPGCVRISFAGTVNHNAMDIIKLSFTVVESTSTLSSVRIISADLYNEAAVKIAPACKDGKVMLTDSTSEFTPGNLDGDNDGNITSWDAVLLASILEGKSVPSVIFEAGDVNGDGWIDDQDLLVLMKQLIA